MEGCKFFVGMDEWMYERKLRKAERKNADGRAKERRIQREMEKYRQERGRTT